MVVMEGLKAEVCRFTERRPQARAAALRMSRSASTASNKPTAFEME